MSKILLAEQMYIPVVAVVAVVSDGILEAGIAELSDDEDELRIIDYRGHSSVNIS